MRRNFLSILIFIILVLFVYNHHNLGILRTSIRSEGGPFYYLVEVLDAMREFRKSQGHYASDFRLLKSHKNIKDEKKGKGYTYKIVYADENSFLIISHNNRGLRDYQITEESNIPTWYFKNEQERKEALRSLIGVVEKYKHNPELAEKINSNNKRIGNELWGALNDLKNFSYDEVGKYLFNLIRESDDLSLIKGAARTLSSTMLYPSKEIINEFSKLDEEKTCATIMEVPEVMHMVLRSNEKETIKSVINLYEWGLNNCKENYHPIYGKAMFESVIDELNEKLDKIASE